MTLFFRVKTQFILISQKKEHVSEDLENQLYDYVPESEPKSNEHEPINENSSHFSITFENISIRRGEHVAIIGAVGSGKSAILKAISGHVS